MPSAQGKRARFKKGQKILFPEPSTTEDGDIDLLWHEGRITRGEKYTDPVTGQVIFYYDVIFPKLNKGAESRYEEEELYKYNVDLINGVASAEADDIRANAKAATEAKRILEQHSVIPPQMRLTIPPSLKKMVLDDYDLIMHQGKILPLPRPAFSKPSVTQLIRDWQIFRKIDEEEELCLQIDEISDKLIEYFDLSLRQFLLYQPEVAACDLALATTGEVPSQIYGAEHLVRLIVKLPQLVPVVLMSSPGNAQYIITVEGELGDLLAWATEDTRKENLIAAPEEYILNPHWTPPVIATTGGALNTPGAKKGGKGGVQQENEGEGKAMDEDGDEPAVADRDEAEES